MRHRSTTEHIIWGNGLKETLNTALIDEIPNEAPEQYGAHNLGLWLFAAGRCTRPCPVEKRIEVVRGHILW